MVRIRGSLLLAASALTLASAEDDLIQARNFIENPIVGAPPNDFACRSQVHPNPVIMLHGLSANREVDLNVLSWELKDDGYCVFSKTYGAHPLFRLVGGVMPMRESAVEIADFIREVHAKTGASKVDLVGHSEGGVMALYVPMTQDGISDIVERNIALGPAIHGAQYFGLTDLFYLGGEVTRELAARVLKTIGCSACDDMATGGNVYLDFKNADRIVQPGNKATVIVSTSDTLVEPKYSFVEEEGARNLVVQDTCPDDRVGHAGLAWDKSVWGLIVNALQEDYDREFPCEKGLPI